MLAKEMFMEWHDAESPNVVYSPPETSRESRDLNSLAMRVIVAAGKLVEPTSYIQQGTDFL